jgi:hypothetical protein
MKIGESKSSLPQATFNSHPILIFVGSCCPGMWIWPRARSAACGLGKRAKLAGKILRAPELGVGGAPDLAHATLTKLGGDAVMGNGCLRTHRV